MHAWDVASRRLLWERPVPDGLVVEGVAFSPDGGALRVTEESGAVHELAVAPPRVAAQVCARAGRTLTEAEWREHLGDIPYRDVCATA